MSAKIYGIPNCDTVQKAIKWLKENNVEYEFHDFKKSGISEEKLQDWSSKLGWEVLINKRGTTWKELAPQVQNSVNSPKTAFALIQEKTSLIKRPVLENKGKVLIGFDPAVYKDTFSG